jgi:hypothetical protein
MEQPPCIFYRTIVGEFKRSILVTIGGNPCHDEAVGMSGVEWWKGTAFQDLATMVYAHNFASARSTFASMALYLSPFRKTRLWTFDDESLGLAWQNMADFGPHVNCVATDEMRRIEIFGWSSNIDQIASIKNGTCTFQEWNK